MIRPLPLEISTRLRSGVAITSFAQCVEELVLNSIDAGSTCVAVRVDLTCCRLQVVDNGTGISRMDLESVAERYSTSKCHHLEDLDNLGHYGYRGEALASVRDTSHILEISSRHKLSTSTYNRVFREGKGLDIFQAAVPRPSTGTTITIHDLFYTLPVRRKCMNESLELERVRGRIEAIALIHPQTSMSLRNDCNGNKILQTHKSSGLIGAFGYLYGNPKSVGLKEIQRKHEEFDLSGFISVDSHHNRNLQFVYVNKRLVLKTRIHKLLNYILSKSLIVKKRGASSGEFTPKIGTNSPSSPLKYSDRHPIYVINITCPLSRYDITFEPTKTLVEFKHWSGVLECVQAAAQRFLQEENLTMKSETVPEGTTETTEENSDPLAFDSQDSQEEIRDVDIENMRIGKNNGGSHGKIYGQNISTVNLTNTLHSIAVRRPSKVSSPIGHESPREDADDKGDSVEHSDERECPVESTILPPGRTLSMAALGNGVSCEKPILETTYDPPSKSPLAILYETTQSDQVDDSKSVESESPIGPSNIENNTRIISEPHKICESDISQLLGTDSEIIDTNSTPCSLLPQRDKTFISLSSSIESSYSEFKKTFKRLSNDDLPKSVTTGKDSFDRIRAKLEQRKKNQDVVTEDFQYGSLSELKKLRASDEHITKHDTQSSSLTKIKQIMSKQRADKMEPRQLVDDSVERLPQSSCTEHRSLESVHTVGNSVQTDISFKNIQNTNPKAIPHCCLKSSNGTIVDTCQRSASCSSGCSTQSCGLRKRSSSEPKQATLSSKLAKLSVESLKSKDEPLFTSTPFEVTMKSDRDSTASNIHHHNLYRPNIADGLSQDLREIGSFPDFSLCGEDDGPPRLDFYADDPSYRLPFGNSETSDEPPTLVNEYHTRYYRSPPRVKKSVLQHKVLTSESFIQTTRDILSKKRVSFDLDDESQDKNFTASSSHSHQDRGEHTWFRPVTESSPDLTDRSRFDSSGDMRITYSNGQVYNQSDTGVEQSVPANEVLSELDILPKTDKILLEPPRLVQESNEQNEMSYNKSDWEKDEDHTTEKHTSDIVCDQEQEHNLDESGISCNDKVPEDNNSFTSLRSFTDEANQEAFVENNLPMDPPCAIDTSAESDQYYIYREDGGSDTSKSVHTQLPNVNQTFETQETMPCGFDRTIAEDVESHIHQVSFDSFNEIGPSQGFTPSRYTNPEVSSPEFTSEDQFPTWEQSQGFVSVQGGPSQGFNMLASTSQGFMSEITNTVMEDSGVELELVNCKDNHQQMQDVSSSSELATIDSSVEEHPYSDIPRKPELPEEQLQEETPAEDSVIIVNSSPEISSDRLSEHPATDVCTKDSLTELAEAGISNVHDENEESTSVMSCDKLDQPRTLQPYSADQWTCQTDKTGRKLYIHMVTGNSSYKEPVIQSDNNTRTVAMHRSHPMRTCSNTVLQQFIYQAPSVRKSKVMTLSPGSQGQLTTMFGEHLENRSTEDHGKWRTGEYKKVSESVTIAKMFESWTNPAFSIPEQSVLNVESGQYSRSSVNVHKALQPYTLNKQMLACVKVLGQIDNKFIACLLGSDNTDNTKGDSLVVVDQHAAHERIRLENFIEASYKETDTGSRVYHSTIMTPPLQITLAPQEIRIMNSYRQQLDNMGLQFSIDPTKPCCVQIHRVPTCLIQREADEEKRGKTPIALEIIETFIKEQVDLYEKTHGAGATLPKTFVRVLASQACHGAIKFGDRLSMDQCKELLGCLATCDLPFQCAHGRPSIIPILSLNALKNTFKTEKRAKPKLWTLVKKMEQEPQS